MTEQTPMSSPEITSDDRMWAMLAYILSPLVPIVILLMEDKKNRPFIKAHNIQALVWGVVIYVISGVLSFVFIGCFIGLAGFIMSIIWGLKANKGEYVTIPVISDFVKNQGWA